MFGRRAVEVEQRVGFENDFFRARDLRLGHGRRGRHRWRRAALGLDAGAFDLLFGARHMAARLVPAEFAELVAGLHQGHFATGELCRSAAQPAVRLEFGGPLPQVLAQARRPVDRRCLGRDAGVVFQRQEQDRGLAQRAFGEGGAVVACVLVAAGLDPAAGLGQRVGRQCRARRVGAPEIVVTLLQIGDELTVAGDRCVADARRLQRQLARHGVGCGRGNASGEPCGKGCDGQRGHESGDRRNAGAGRHLRGGLELRAGCGAHAGFSAGRLHWGCNAGRWMRLARGRRAIPGAHAGSRPARRRRWRRRRRPR